MKTAIIDVGGGMRGIYAAGVLDCCLDEHIRFDRGIGISAGSANLSSFFAGQRGRNKQFYIEYSFRKEYMGMHNFLMRKSFLDLDYIYGTLSNSDGENPLDYPALAANPAEFYVLACNALTGETKCFGKEDIAQDRYDVLKASSAIPFVCKPYVIGGIPYYDGALGDTIPIDLALDCDKIVLILTKPRYVLRTSGKDSFFAKRIEKQYPRAAECLRTRAERYNAGVTKAIELEKAGKVLIVAPEDTEGVDTLTRDKEAFERLYTRGYTDGHRIGSFLAEAAVK